jgi:hypothetical protein
MNIFYCIGSSEGQLIYCRHYIPVEEIESV